MRATFWKLGPLEWALAVATTFLGAGLVLSAFEGTEVGLILGTPAGIGAAREWTSVIPSVQRDWSPIERQVLFHVHRAYFPPPDPHAKPLELPAYEVTGSLIIPRQPAMAFLKPRSGGAVLSVKPGDDIAGWRVEAVESGRVELSFGEQHAELVKGSPKGTTVTSAGLVPSRSGVTVAVAQHASGIRVLAGSSASAGTNQLLPVGRPRVERRVLR